MRLSSATDRFFLRALFGVLFAMALTPAFADDAKPSDDDDPIAGHNLVVNVVKMPTETVYRDYESQIIDIFKSLSENDPSKEMPSLYPVFEGKKAKELMKIYLQKMQNHEMHIKNIVFRTDIKNIRVTYGDATDHYLFKIAYSTSYDTVLVNSRYADKDAIDDIKLIYYENGKLNYVWIYHGMNTKRKKIDAAGAGNPKNEFIMNYNMADERCGFCHELAKHDGSNTGLFFSRYQYKKSFAGNGLDNESLNGIFKESSFVLTKKSDSGIADVLGDRMPDSFYYQRFKSHTSGKRSDQNPPFSMLLEMPELIEVLARDNNKNYCMSIDFIDGVGVSDQNYICADVEAKKLYVHYENPWSVKRRNENDPNFKPTLIHYDKNFWNNPVMPNKPAAGSGYAAPDKTGDGKADDADEAKDDQK